MRKNPQTKTTKVFQYNVSLVRIILADPGYPWFKNFSWLHYSKEKESVFCIFCIRHKGKLTAEHNMEEAYITKGFNNWKKALEAFVDHQQSKAHRAAITYESVVPQCGDVLK